MAIYVEAPLGTPKLKISCPIRKSIFLAGGISGCSNWQAVVALSLGCSPYPANRGCQYVQYEPGDNKLLNEHWRFLLSAYDYALDMADNNRTVKPELNPHLIVYNPRRAAFDIENDKMSEEQIAWEFRQIAAASAVSFWFTNETLQPITLFELGKCLEKKDKTLFIGYDPGYARAKDLEIQIGLANPTLPLYNSLLDLTSAINRWAKYEGERFRWDGK